MVSSISLGSVVTGKGSTQTSGLASGLDSNALIEDILSAKQSTIDSLKDDITVNTDKITATDEMFLLLDRFKTATNLLRDEPGINNESNFVFNYRTANVASNGSKDGASYVDVTATPGASVGEYEISDVSLAKKHTIVLSGFSGDNESVVSGETVASRFTVTSNETLSGTALDTSNPLSFHAGYDNNTTVSNATISLQFANNQFEATDILTIGDSNIAFGTDVSVGTDTEETLQNVANYLNNITTGDEALYSYTVSGGDSLVITRDAPGSDDDVGTDLNISSDFSNGSDTSQTLAIGANGALNSLQSATLNTAGTDGSLYTQANDANTTFTPTLAGPLSRLTANYNTGTLDGTTGFDANSISFSVTVGGETYTSQTIDLSNGSLDLDSNGAGDLGNGSNGLGNLLAAGTELIFTKDTDSDPTADTIDVAFSLKTGAAVTINDQSEATDVADDIEAFLSTNNLKIAQDFDSTDDTNDLISTSPAIGFRAGTFDLNGIDITLNEGDSLDNIKAKINAVSVTTGVQAEVLKIADNNYTLQLQSTKTGADNKIASYGDGDLGDPENGRIQFGGSSLAFSQTQEATDASFKFNGIDITRSDNVISDVVDNVTFSLKSETSVNEPDTDIIISIEPDTDVIFDGVVDVLNKYNDLKFFISAQTEKDEAGDFTEDAKLAEDSILSETLRAIDTEITSSVSGIAGSLKSVFNVGIDFTDFAGDGTLLPTDNIFKLDSDKLKASLQSDFEGVKNIFAFNLTSDSTDLSVFSRTNDLSLTNFKLDIDESRDDGEKVRVLDNSDNFLFFADYNQTTDRFGNVTAAGGTITGRSGTALSGLTLIYSGDGTDNINVNTSQGIADRLYNYLDEELDSETGSLAEFISGLQDENTDITDEITDDEERIEIEREFLVRKFAALEAAISKANNILRLFSAEETERSS